MDKMVYTAMNDPLVNQKLNQGGMTVGFAAGGMAQSPYNDPTRIDQVIGQFMQMTKNNPGLMDELAKRGITINRTPATNQPGQMQAQNAPAQTTNPVTNQAPVMANEGTYLDPLSMSSLGIANQPFTNTMNTEQTQSYATSPTSVSSMYGIPGGSYLYQGPGLPRSPEEGFGRTPPVCAPGTVYDEESDSCVPEVEPDEATEPRGNNNMDGIGGTEMSTPYVEKGWRVQSTEQLDWSNPKDFDAYMKELSKPQEKVSGLAKAVSLANPLWGPAMVIGQKMERKATVNKIKAMENIANLIGDTVSAASAVKAGESYKASLTESQREYADTQNGEGYTITLVNQIMGRGFLDDIEGTRGNGFHSVADLQNMPQSKKDELKAAIDANNSRLKSEIEITPTTTSESKPKKRFVFDTASGKTKETTEPYVQKEIGSSTADTKGGEGSVYIAPPAPKKKKKKKKPAFDNSNSPGNPANSKPTFDNKVKYDADMYKKGGLVKKPKRK